MANQLPRYAVLILTAIVDKRDVEQRLGDLEEQYRKRVEKHGKKHADRWLSLDLLVSSGPYLVKLIVTQVIRIFIQMI